MRSSFALKRFEKRYLMAVAVIWIVTIVFSLASPLRSASANDTVVPITVYETNTVNVRVPTTYDDLRAKYLLIARLYEEMRINANILAKHNSDLIATNAYALHQLDSLLSKKDAPKNIVSLGNIISPSFGFEASYYRNIVGILWAYARLQTPVGASAGIGIAW